MRPRPAQPGTHCPLQVHTVGYSTASSHREGTVQQLQQVLLPSGRLSQVHTVPCRYTQRGTVQQVHTAGYSTAGTAGTPSGRPAQTGTHCPLQVHTAGYSTCRYSRYSFRAAGSARYTLSPAGTHSGVQYSRYSRYSFRAAGSDRYTLSSAGTHSGVQYSRYTQRGTVQQVQQVHSVKRWYAEAAWHELSSA